MASNGDIFDGGSSAEEESEFKVDDSSIPNEITGDNFNIDENNKTDSSDNNNTRETTEDKNKKSSKSKKKRKVRKKDSLVTSDTPDSSIQTFSEASSIILQGKKLKKRPKAQRPAFIDTDGEIERKLEKKYLELENLINRQFVERKSNLTHQHIGQMEMLRQQYNLSCHGLPPSGPVSYKTKQRPHSAHVYVPSDSEDPYSTIRTIQNINKFRKPRSQTRSKSAKSRRETCSDTDSHRHKRIDIDMETDSLGSARGVSPRLVRGKTRVRDATGRRSPRARSAGSSQPVTSPERHGFLPTDHKLQTTDNPKIREWLHKKNTLIRKQKASERAEKREKRKESLVRESKKEMERQIGKEHVKEWMLRKKREALQQAKEEKIRQKKLEIEELEEKERKKMGFVEGKSWMRPVSAPASRSINRSSTEASRDEQSTSTDTEKPTTTPIPHPPSSKRMYKRAPAGRIRLKMKGKEKTESGEEVADKSDKEDQLSYTEWLKRKREADKKKKAEFVTGESQTEVDPYMRDVLPELQKKRMDRVLNSKKKLDTGLKSGEEESGCEDSSLKVDGSRASLASRNNYTRPQSALAKPPAPLPCKSPKRPKSAHPRVDALMKDDNEDDANEKNPFHLPFPANLGLPQEVAKTQSKIFPERVAAERKSLEDQRLEPQGCDAGFNDGMTVSATANGDDQNTEGAAVVDPGDESPGDESPGEQTLLDPEVQGAKEEEPAVLLQDSEQKTEPEVGAVFFSDALDDDPKPQEEEPPEKSTSPDEANEKDNEKDNQYFLGDGPDKHEPDKVVVEECDQSKVTELPLEQIPLLGNDNTQFNDVLEAKMNRGMEELIEEQESKEEDRKEEDGKRGNGELEGKIENIEDTQRLVGNKEQKGENTDDESEEQEAEGKKESMDEKFEEQEEEVKEDIVEHQPEDTPVEQVGEEDIPGEQVEEEDIPGEQVEEEDIPGEQVEEEDTPGEQVDEELKVTEAEKSQEMEDKERGQDDTENNKVPRGGMVEEELLKDEQQEELEDRDRKTEEELILKEQQEEVEEEIQQDGDHVGKENSEKNLEKEENFQKDVTLDAELIEKSDNFNEMKSDESNENIGNDENGRGKDISEDDFGSGDEQNWKLQSTEDSSQYFLDPGSEKHEPDKTKDHETSILDNSNFEQDGIQNQEELSESKDKEFSDNSQEKPCDERSLLEQVVDSLPELDEEREFQETIPEEVSDDGKGLEQNERKIETIQETGEQIEKRQKNNVDSLNMSAQQSPVCKDEQISENLGQALTAGEDLSPTSPSQKLSPDTPENRTEFPVLGEKEDVGENQEDGNSDTKDEVNLINTTSSEDFKNNNKTVETEICPDKQTPEGVFAEDESLISMDEDNQTNVTEELHRKLPDGHLILLSQQAQATATEILNDVYRTICPPAVIDSNTDVVKRIEGGPTVTITRSSNGDPEEPPESEENGLPIEEDLTLSVALAEDPDSSTGNSLTSLDTDDPTTIVKRSDECPQERRGDLEAITDEQEKKNTQINELPKEEQEESSEELTNTDDRYSILVIEQTENKQEVSDLPENNEQIVDSQAGVDLQDTNVPKYSSEGQHKVVEAMHYIEEYNPAGHSPLKDNSQAFVKDTDEKKKIEENNQIREDFGIMDSMEDDFATPSQQKTNDQQHAHTSEIFEDVESKGDETTTRSLNSDEDQEVMQHLDGSDEDQEEKQHLDGSDEDQEEKQHLDGSDEDHEVMQHLDGSDEDQEEMQHLDGSEIKQYEEDDGNDKVIESKQIGESKQRNSNKISEYEDDVNDDVKMAQKVQQNFDDPSEEEPHSREGASFRVIDKPRKPERQDASNDLSVDSDDELFELKKRLRRLRSSEDFSEIVYSSRNLNELDTSFEAPKLSATADGDDFGENGDNRGGLEENDDNTGAEDLNNNKKPTEFVNGKSGSDIESVPENKKSVSDVNGNGIDLGSGKQLLLENVNNEILKTEVYEKNLKNEKNVTDMNSRNSNDEQELMMEESDEKPRLKSILIESEFNGLGGPGGDTEDNAETTPAQSPRKKVSFSGSSVIIEPDGREVLSGIGVDWEVPDSPEQPGSDWEPTDAQMMMS